jgi:hypothetical protein
MQIQSLKPNVTREEAVKYFTDWTANAAIGMLRGPVQSIADLYLPFRLYQVRFTNSGKEEKHFFALDAAAGVLDLYEFSAPPAESDLCTVESRNVLPAVLEATKARERVIAKVRRLIFARGFFRLRDFELAATQIPGELYVPYWICFRGTDGQVHISVLDAVRRRPEGAKARHLVEEWLRGEIKPSP